MKSLILLTIALIATFFTLTNAQTNPKVFKGVVGRTWYIGGSITQAKQADNSTLTANNLVTWNGTTFGDLGGVGPNGKVRAITSDLCRNVYVGGDFTKVDKINGPAARWNFLNRAWERVGGEDGDITFNTGAEIHDIAVNCRNWPDSFTKCPCSVYLVGKFVATIKSSGKVATNVVKFEYSSKLWDNLGGAVSHGMTTGSVNNVYTKEFGKTEAVNIVWFGGSFSGSLQRYDISTSKWGFGDATVAKKLSGSVVGMFYKQEITGTDKLYIAGNFTGVEAEGGLCNKVCYFDYKTEKFHVVGKNNIPDGIVTTIGVNIDDLYIGGSFKNSGTKYIAKLVSGTDTWVQLDTTDAANIDGAINSVSVCSKTQGLEFDCSGGSTAAVGGQLTKYWDSGDKKWNDFGGGITGDAQIVFSQISSAQSLTHASFALIFSIISVALFL